MCIRDRKLTIREKPAPEVEAPAPLPRPVGGITHTVADKETLFAISKKYKVAVNDIIRWNNLKSSELRSGQRIFVSDPGDATVAAPAPAKEADRNTPPARNAAPADPNTVRINPVQNDEVHEKGFALVMPGTEGNRKYLGYHRSVKPGTVLRIKNTSSQKEIFVRILGPLPASDPSDVLIRVSKIAADKLGGEDRMPVELVYFP